MSVLRLPLRPEFFRSVESIICKAFLHKLFSVFAVDPSSLALPVWGMRMTLRGRFHYIAFRIDTLVRYYSAPVERFNDIFLCPRDKPLRVSIFNPYDEISSVLLGIEVIVKGRPYSSHVKGTCRGRCKPYPCLTFHNVQLTLNEAQKYKKNLIPCTA